MRQRLAIAHAGQRPAYLSGKGADLESARGGAQVHHLIEAAQPAGARSFSARNLAEASTSFSAIIVAVLAQRAVATGTKARTGRRN